MRELFSIPDYICDFLFFIYLIELSKVAENGTTEKNIASKKKYFTQKNFNETLTVS